LPDCGLVVKSVGAELPVARWVYKLQRGNFRGAPASPAAAAAVQLGLPVQMQQV